MIGFDSIDESCERVMQLSDSYISDELEAAGKDAVRVHLEICQVCSEVFEERQRLKRLVQRAVRREMAPESLRRNIQEIIRES